jgi:hypothetical protein
VHMPHGHPNGGAWQMTISWSLSLSWGWAGGSLGRGMQADGVWASLAAARGPVAAIPARADAGHRNLPPSIRVAACRGQGPVSSAPPVCSG